MGKDDQLMDTEPGGESTQYESIKTIDVPTKRDSGSMGSDEPRRRESDVSEERGQKTADNIRYGQNISESGMGGKTNSTGSAGQEGGLGGTAREPESEEKGTRASQGYGSGSGVGG